MRDLVLGRLCVLALAVLGAPGAAGAKTTFLFDTPPFKGTTALQTPGRQIIGGEISIPLFDFDADVLAFHAPVFGLSAPLSIFRGEAGAIPAAGANVIVLTTFDFDSNPANGNQLNAGQAANLIAAMISDPAPGFFVYFNSFLDLPRLVFSTDLSSSQADLKILARFTGLNGAAGRDQTGRFGPANFAAVPEPASWALMILGFGLVGALGRRRLPVRVAG